MAPTGSQIFVSLRFCLIGNFDFTYRTFLNITLLSQGKITEVVLSAGFSSYNALDKPSYEVRLSGFRLLAFFHGAKDLYFTSQSIIYHG